jgi:CPA2 family monovalent cation:H+ antiporter-2
LYSLGADEVIPEEFETSIEIFSRVLHRYGMARSVVESQVDRIRKQGYEMLRSPNVPTAPMQDVRSALNAAGAETVNLPADSPVLGKNLAELDLRSKTGATLIAVVRDGETRVSPGANFRLLSGDTAVLLGSPESIEKAVEFLVPNQNAFEHTLRGFNP